MSLVPVLTILLLSCMPTPSQIRYDAKTWRGWPEAEREKFLNGYIAYLIGINEDQPFQGQLASYERQLSAHIDSVPASNSAEVADLLRLVAPRVGRPPRGGERYTGKYGIFLGSYWVELEKREVRIRFLQGYLYAQQRDTKSTERYSKGPEIYEQLVSAEFEKPESDRERGIGEVLSLFRDK